MTTILFFGKPVAESEKSGMIPAFKPNMNPTMIKQSLRLSGVSVLAAFAISANAQFNQSIIGPTIHHWQFNEPNGTPLTGAQDSVGAASFNYDIGQNATTLDQTSTVQSGTFNVRRPGGGHHINSYAPIDAVGLTYDKIYVVADVTWDYSGSTSGADFRMGFHNAIAAESHTSPTTGDPPVTILAEIVLRRNAAELVQVGAWGTETDGAVIVSPNEATAPWTTVGGHVQATPVRLVLELDQVDRWGAVHFSMDGGATFSTVGGNGHTFDINGTWDPNFLRLGALNNFVSGTGEGLFIQDMFVAVPEPSTYALGILGLAALYCVRRRKR